jgi:Immunoglobulin I-set domain
MPLLTPLPLQIKFVRQLWSRILPTLIFGLVCMGFVGCGDGGSGGGSTSNQSTSTPVVTGPTITAQPASQTVTVGGAATFSITATGTAPLAYQWRRNGSNIVGATSSSYRIAATATTDNGATFSVVVANSAGSAQSDAATLSVNPATGRSHHHATQRCDCHRRTDRDVYRRR